ncbi:MAG: glutamate 5-kinase [Candidatus Lindowbacteria bacterium RIFCSPLOWO2_12_FULL_62_27]|nr:MAG: glutamate 5-kinase [Candidatus Lindowbacteria bacterium RIFCSPLOWO2_12_FULL_62_27]
MKELDRADFSTARRVVIKVGTSLLRGADHAVDRGFLKNIAAQIAETRSLPDRRQIILVSSGAVGFGMMRLGLSRRPADVATLQAAAAVGQPELMKAWADAFAPHSVRVSQILLTNDGLQDRARFVNAKHAIRRILDLNVVPVVNENDTVAVDELTFGDNDTLSALVAAMVDADLLINLTNVDGFFAPSDGGGRTLLKTVPVIRPEWITATQAGERSERGRRGGFTLGGMSAKLKAARLALRAGIPVVIANGREKKILAAVLSGRPAGTLFLPQERGLKGKKVWLSLFRAPAGTIVVDRGAAAAVGRNGKSLLASGILRATGQFSRQDCVSIVSEDGREIARGISAYSSGEIQTIAGCPSTDIRRRLGIAPADAAPAEVIHRDNMALLP